MMKITVIAIMSAMAPLAEAHTGLGLHGLMSGLSHPFLGLDHLLAMVAIGIWAGRTGGDARWRIPLAFITTMSVSALLSQGQASIPLIETGIALSVLLLGLFIVLAVKLPAGMGMIVVSLFAVFHGAAHGSEWPEAFSPVWYVFGFVLATSVLHAIGVIAVVTFIDKSHLFARLAGALIAATGGVMLLAS